MDVVGYSKLVIDQQTELTQKLNEIAANASQFRIAEAEGTLVMLATGDEIVVIFRNHRRRPRNGSNNLRSRSKSVGAPAVANCIDSKGK